MHRGQHEEKADSQMHKVSQAQGQQEVGWRLGQDRSDLFTPGSGVSAGCLAAPGVPSFPFSAGALSLTR